MTPPAPSPIPVVSPFPPWSPFSHMFNLSLHVPFHKTHDVLLAPQLFLEMVALRYSGFLRMFTDGSHLQSPATSSAAIFIEPLSITKIWRLDGHHSVVASELYAILGALSFIKDFLSPQPIVLFSDSQSSLYLLCTPYPASHRRLVFEVQSLLSSLCSAGYVLRLQWIPSHAGIRGNTVVDSAASLAHSSPSVVPYPLDHHSHSSLILHSCQTH